jgi:hypothetical protein
MNEQTQKLSVAEWRKKAKELAGVTEDYKQATFWDVALDDNGKRFLLLNAGIEIPQRSQIRGNDGLPEDTAFIRRRYKNLTNIERKKIRDAAVKMKDFIDEVAKGLRVAF